MKGFMIIIEVNHFSMQNLSNTWKSTRWQTLCHINPSEAQFTKMRAGFQSELALLFKKVARYFWRFVKLLAFSDPQLLKQNYSGNTRLITCLVSVGRQITTSHGIDYVW